MTGSVEKSVSSNRGTTFYWTNEIESAVSLVFLSGLTAGDDRLLNKIRFGPVLL